MSDEKSLADLELEQALGSIRAVGENRDSHEHESSARVDDAS